MKTVVSLLALAVVYLLFFSYTQHSFNHSQLEINDYQFKINASLSKNDSSFLALALSQDSLSETITTAVSQLQRIAINNPNYGVRP